MQIPPEVSARVKRGAELEAEKQRVFKAWDSIANTAFGLLSSRKESSPVDLAGIEASVDQIADLLRLKLEVIKTFQELGQSSPPESLTEDTANGGGGGS
jgi:hypothetical protein